MAILDYIDKLEMCQTADSVPVPRLARFDFGQLPGRGWTGGVVALIVSACARGTVRSDLPNHQRGASLLLFGHIGQQGLLPCDSDSCKHYPRKQMHFWIPLTAMHSTLGRR